MTRRSERRKVSRTAKRAARLRDKDVSKAVELDVDVMNDNDQPPVFSFKHVDNNRYRLSEWWGDELDQLVETFKKMESLRWPDIHRHSGLDCKHVEPYEYIAELPEMISPDVKILQIRASKKSRIFGYRWKHVFRLVWFDKNHDVRPMS